MKRYTGTLVLLGLAAALGAYIFVVESRRPSTSELRDRGKRIASAFERAAVTTIRLERGAEKILLKKDAEKWRVEEPKKFLADSGAVESVLSAVEFLEFLRRIEADPSEYGLDQPRARIALEGGPGLRLRVGSDDPTGRSVYVGREEGGPVYVAERNFLETLQRPLSEFRDKRVLPLDRAKLETLTLLRDGRRTELERDQGTWMMAGPVRTLANAEHVASLLDKLADLKATRIVADGVKGLKEYGLEGSPRSIAVKAGATETLLLGGSCGEHEGEIYAARMGATGAILCLAEEAAAGLLPTEEWLREARILPLSSDDARRVVIEAAQRKLVLERKGEEWSVTEPASQPADDEVVRKWIDDLGAFRATTFVPVDEAAQGLGKPARVTVSGDEHGFTLSFGATAGPTRFVRRNDEQVTMKVHAEVSRSLAPDPLAFRKRRLLDFSRYDVKRIVTRGAGEEEATKDESGAWRLSKPAALPGDSTVIDRVAGALAELAAEKFVAEKATAAHGLGSPSRELAVTVEPPAGLHDHHGEEDGEEEAEKEKVHRVQLGRTLDDQTCYGRLDGEGPVFVLAESTCRTLRSPLVTRKLLSLDESNVVGFILRRGKEEVVLEKRGPDWHRTGAGKVGSSRIEDLLGVIRDARARDVAGYGGDAIAAPRILLTVRTDGAPDQTLTVGGPRADGLEARIAGRGVRYVLDEGLAESLEALTF